MFNDIIVTALCAAFAGFFIDFLRRLHCETLYIYGERLTRAEPFRYGAYMLTGWVLLVVFSVPTLAGAYVIGSRILTGAD